MAAFDFADRWRTRTRAPVGAANRPRRLGPAVAMPGQRATSPTSRTAALMPYWDRQWTRCLIIASRKYYGSRLP